MDSNRIIHVRLKEPYNGEQDYYFGSIAAIYDVLPREVVGYAKSTLYMAYAKSGYNLFTGRARIRTMPIHRSWKNKQTQI